MDTSIITDETTLGTLFLNRETGVVYRYTGMYRGLGEDGAMPTFMSFSANGASTVRNTEDMGDVELMWEAPEVLAGIDLVKNGEVEHFEFREDRLNAEVLRLTLDGWYVVLTEQHMQEHVNRLHNRGASSVETALSGSVYCHDHQVAHVAA